MGQQILLCGRLLGRVCLFFIFYSAATSMKAERQIARTIASEDQREEGKIQQLLLVDCGREGIVSMLSMHELRTQQDLIFSENIEIYNLLNSPPVPQLQGLTYAEINSSERLTHALMIMRANAPAYQHMSRRKKTYYLKDLARRYDHKMKSCLSSCMEKALLVGDWSEGQSNGNTNQSSLNRSSQTTAKHKKIKKTQKIAENPLSKAKRLTFLTQSDCKYFSSPNPPISVQTLPLHFFTTH